LKDLFDLSFIDDENVRRYESMVIADFIDRNSDTDIEVIIKKRKTGIPLSYILNEAYFFDHIFYVDENVLIPRSETELVVEQAISRINVDTNIVLDIGTGSGAIALTIASKFPACEIIASDISENALIVAKKNAINNNINNISFVESDLFATIDNKLQKSFDLIISNPPYIGDDEISELDQSVKDFEPHLALFAEDNGFAIYEKIINQAKDWLKPGGYLVLEIAPRHKDNIFIKMQDNNYSEIEIKNDYNDRPRIAIARKSFFT
jgi:release factor glutamine methyltransferase